MYIFFKKIQKITTLYLKQGLICDNYINNLGNKIFRLINQQFSLNHNPYHNYFHPHIILYVSLIRLRVVFIQQIHAHNNQQTFK